MESVSQKFKVGDRVQVKVGTVAGLRFWDSQHGKFGVVTQISTDYVDRPKIHVNFDDGRTDEGHPDNLTLIESAAASAPRAITLDGITYTLTPVEAEVAEVKREPKRGEVWRRPKTNELLLRTDDTRVKWIAVKDEGSGVGSVWVIEPNVEFAYPSLAAAAADGALS